jgi:hypothetical protein
MFIIHAGCGEVKHLFYNGQHLMPARMQHEKLSMNYVIGYLLAIERLAVRRISLHPVHCRVSLSAQEEVQA